MLAAPLGVGRTPAGAILAPCAGSCTTRLQTAQMILAWKQSVGWSRLERMELQCWSPRSTTGTSSFHRCTRGAEDGAPSPAYQFYRPPSAERLAAYLPDHFRTVLPEVAQERWMAVLPAK